MRIAESLYMAGLISYPRVDNTVYPRRSIPGAVVSDLAKIARRWRPYAKRCSPAP